MTTPVERLTQHPKQIQKTQEKMTLNTGKKKMKQLLHIYLGSKA
jgi:hypothetical protein